MKKALMITFSPILALVLSSSNIKAAITPNPSEIEKACVTDIKSLDIDMTHDPSFSKYLKDKVNEKIGVDKGTKTFQIMKIKLDMANHYKEYQKDQKRGQEILTECQKMFKEYKGLYLPDLKEEITNYLKQQRGNQISHQLAEQLKTYGIGFKSDYIRADKPSTINTAEDALKLFGLPSNASKADFEKLRSACEILKNKFGN